MALEVPVFGEITKYQPKVLFGLSWRQLAVVGVAIPVLGGLYAALYMAGLDDLGVVVVCLLAIPAALIGWVRPMGVKFEKYVGYWWAHQQSRSPFVYAEVKDRDVDHGEKTKKKQEIRRFEAPCQTEESLAERD